MLFSKTTVVIAGRTVTIAATATTAATTTASIAGSITAHAYARYRRYIIVNSVSSKASVRPVLWLLLR